MATLFSREEKERLARECVARGLHITAASVLRGDVNPANVKFALSLMPPLDQEKGRSA